VRAFTAEYTEVAEKSQSFIAENAEGGSEIAEKTLCLGSHSVFRRPR